jgi:hypothetical protein
MESVQYKPLPYDRLATTRNVSTKKLPVELAEFYSQHEGFGINNFVDLSLRFALLQELEIWELGKTCMRGMDDPEWRKFKGYLVAASIFGDEVYYVIEGPLPHGTILMLGANVPPGIMDGALVLSRSFAEWIIYLKEHNLHDDAILHRDEITQKEIAALDLRLNELNPLRKSRSSG